MITRVLSCLLLSLCSFFSIAQLSKPDIIAPKEASTQIKASDIVQLGTATAIDNHAAKSGSFFHPNPVHNSMIINESIEGTLTIMDVEGNPVKSTEHVEGNSKVDMSSLSSGVYLLRLLQEDGQRVYGSVVKE